MVPHRFSINLNKEGYQKIINVRASDNEIHRLYISISNGTEPVELNDNIVSTIYCFKPNGEKIWNNCKISNNEVICDFGGDVLNCCGDVVCELFLSTLGTNIITPKFVLSVESTLPFPHFNLLEEQPENWLDEADLYYTKNENGDFVPVELNANRSLLSDIEFPYNKTIGNIEYRTTKALNFDFNRKLYISYYGPNSDITLRYEFYYSIKGNLTELIASYTSIKKTIEIIIPNITKRQLIEKGYDGIRLVLTIPTNCLTSDYKATDWVLEYDECSYKNCKTPYFEKGKYYIMTNDYGKSGEQYNALIKAITEAREFYNKAISDIKLVDNCLTIDFVNGEKYVSSSLKGNGIKSFAKVSTVGNIDTYEFVADNGEKFSFSVTNTDNSVLEEIKGKLENKVNNDIYNQKITEIENIINTLRTEKVGTDDFTKSVSELQSLIAEVKAYATNVNNEKLDISTFENAVTDINNAITVLQNGKVDNGTYVDDMNAVNASIDSIVKNANALLEMIQSNVISLNQKIDTVAIRGADLRTKATVLTNVQKEGTTLALYSASLFSDTPSDTTTYSGNKIKELLDEKESLDNKADPGGNGEKHIKYPSLAYLEKYFYNKTETDNLLGDKAEKSAVDNNTFDLSMLMSSLKRTATGTNIVNITNTAENGILKVTANGGVTCKNKNIFEDILNDSIRKFNCNVSYDKGTYTVEYTGDVTNTFFFGNIVEVGNKYNVALGKKLKYYKDLSIRINCDKLTRKGCYITYFNSEDVALQTTNYSTNTTYKIDDVEGAEYFTMRIGFDYNNGVIATGDIVNFSVQIEYGDTVSDYVVPQSNTDNLSYEGVTNVVGEGNITVQYVPDVMSYIDKKFNEVSTALIASESEVN